MAENNGTVISKISTLTPLEYVTAILETGTPIDVIEDFVVRKMADIKSEIDNLPIEKKSEITAKQKELLKFESILKEIKKQLVKNATEQSLKENIEKTKECYKETLELGEEVIKYIESITLDEYFDVTSACRNLSEKNKKFKEHVNIQLELNKKNVEYLNTLKTEHPELDNIDQYQAMLPVFEGKEYDYVKEKYKLTVLKIRELEEKDKEQNEILIEELYKTIDDVLPCMLTNSKDMESIKKEVAADLGIEYVPEISDDDDDKKPEKPEITPATEQEDPKFIAAKNEYISTVGYINELIEQLETINDQQDALAEHPDFNVDRIIDAENRAVSVNNRILEYKNKLSDIEYDNYIKHHILLNLDPEIAEIKVNQPMYSSVLDEFMAKHNSVIEYAYRRMYTISATGKEKESTVEIDTLLRLIDAEHLIINRRLVAERKLDRKFDIIAYMRTHKVDIKAIKAEVEAMDFTEAKADNEIIIKHLETRIEEFKDRLKFLLGVKYLQEIKIDKPNILATEQNANELEISNLIKGLEDDINVAEISEHAKDVLIEKMGKAQDEVYDEYNKFAEKDKAYHSLRVAFKEDFLELMELSDELIALSATALGSDEYVQKRNIFLEQAKGILPKYSGIGIRFNKNPNTNKITFSIYNDPETKEPVSYSLSVMTPEYERELSRRVSVKIKGNSLNLNDKVQNIDRQNAIIATTDKIKVSVLKNSLKVQYTKTMLEDLKALKVKLEIAASAENKAQINVTDGKESKDGTKEYRYIKDPTNLSEAKIVYKDVETGEEIMSTDLLQYEEIKKALEERKTMGR